MSTSDARDRQWLAARRVTARALHPDRGGDPRDFIAAMGALDRAHGRRPDGRRDAPVIVIVRHRRWRRFVATISRLARRTPRTRHRYAHL